MKKTILLLSCLLSLNLLADQCQEEKLMAQIKYESLFKDFMSSRYNKYRAEEFLDDMVSHGGRFFAKLTEPQKELFKLNYKKALTQPDIKAVFDSQLRFESDSAIQKFQWVNDSQIWVCRTFKHGSGASYLPDYNLAGNVYCASLFIPEFTLGLDKNLERDEKIKKVTYLHDGSKKNPGTTKQFGELNLNLTKEEYINLKSKPYCQNKVAVDARDPSGKPNLVAEQKSASGSEKK